MSTTKHKRGGARAGSGAKKRPACTHKVVKSISLSPDVAQMLEKYAKQRIHGNASQIAERALEIYFKTIATTV